MMLCSVLMVSLRSRHHSRSLGCQFVTDWTVWKAMQKELLATAHIASVLIMKSNDAKGLIGFFKKSLFNQESCVCNQATCIL